MLINGKCHCGNIEFELGWEGDPPEIPARACDCSFCVKHGGVWTSSPKSALSVVVHDATLLSKYSFGTRTAEFYVCARCGVVPVTTSELDNRPHAVVNVNTFENVDPSWIQPAPATFEGEELADRLTRRKRNWIADVRITEGTPGS